MIIEAIGIGLVISFLLTEWLGLSAGGLIVPGYFALFVDQPERIAASMAVALVTYWVLKGISQVMILYGRRRFMAAVLIGYLLGGVCRLLVTDFWPLSYDLRVIGYIIPGLIANDMVKQGIWKTVLAVLLASILVRLILLLDVQSF